MINSTPPTIFAVTLPIPPSTNALFSNVSGKGRVKTRAYRDWISEALGEISDERYGMGGVSMPQVPVCVVIQVDRPRADRDIDNCIKPILDVLVSGFVIKDDKLVGAVFACWGDSPEHKAKAKVVVYPAGESPFINFKPSKPGSVTGHLEFRR